MLQRIWAVMMKLIVAGIVIGAVFWFIENPTVAAQGVTWLVNTGISIVEACITFVRAVFGGVDT